MQLRVPSCCNKPFSNAIASGGHYHSACLLCAKERTERHDYVRDCILRMTKEAGMTPRLGANGLVGSNSNSRPADVLIEPPELDQGYRALDVVITYPCSESAMAKGAANWSLTAAKISDTSKLRAHKALISSKRPGIFPYEKIPLSFESSGAFGDNMKILWAELKARHNKIQKEDYIRAGLPYTFTAFMITFSQYWPQRISFAMSKFIARMVMDGLFRAKGRIPLLYILVSALVVSFVFRFSASVFCYSPSLDWFICSDTFRQTCQL